MLWGWIEWSFTAAKTFKDFRALVALGGMWSPALICKVVRISDQQPHRQARKHSLPTFENSVTRSSTVTE